MFSLYNKKLSGKKNKTKKNTTSSKWSNKTKYGVDKTDKYLKKVLESDKTTVDAHSMKDIINKLAQKKKIKETIQKKNKSNKICAWNTLKINCKKKTYCYYNNKKQKCLKIKTNNRKTDNEKTNNEKTNNEKTDNEKTDNEKTDNEKTDNEKTDNEKTVKKEIPYFLKNVLHNKNIQLN